MPAHGSDQWRRGWKRVAGVLWRDLRSSFPPTQKRREAFQLLAAAFFCASPRRPFTPSWPAGIGTGKPSRDIFPARLAADARPTCRLSRLRQSTGILPSQSSWLTGIAWATVTLDPGAARGERRGLAPSTSSRSARSSRRNWSFCGRQFRTSRTSGGRMPQNNHMQATRPAQTSQSRR